MTIVERPLLSRDDVLAAVNPTKPASGRTLRRLQAEGLVTRGIGARPRSGGHARGTILLFSALNRDALSLHRRGHDDEARAVVAHAKALEELIEQALRGERKRIWSDHLGASHGDPIRTFTSLWPNVIVDLGARTNAARSVYRSTFESLGIEWFTGTVHALHEDAAQVTDWNGVSMLLPRRDLRRADSDHEGAPVHVRLENLANGRLLVIEQALLASADAPTADGDSDGGADEDLPRTLRLTRTPLSDGATDRLSQLLQVDSHVHIVAPLPIATR